MRTRLLRGLAAVVLALAVVLPGSAQPAQATTDASDRIITVVFAAFRLINGGLNSSDVEQLVREAIGAVNTATDQVIVHLDAQQAAKAKAAARSASLGFADYQVIREGGPIVLFMFALDVERSATLSKHELEVVADPRAADQIGHALNVTYPIALVAAEDAGLANTRAGMMADYLEANQRIVDELTPTCLTRVAPDTPGHISEVHYECTAANGEKANDYQIRNEATGEWIRGPVNVEQLKDAAAVNSSWAVAKRVLAELAP